MKDKTLAYDKIISDANWSSLAVGFDESLDAAFADRKKAREERVDA